MTRLPFQGFVDPKMAPFHRPILGSISPSRQHLPHSGGIARWEASRYIARPAPARQNTCRAPENVHRVARVPILLATSSSLPMKKRSREPMNPLSDGPPDRCHGLGFFSNVNHKPCPILARILPEENRPTAYREVATGVIVGGRAPPHSNPRRLLPCLRGHRPPARRP